MSDLRAVLLTGTIGSGKTALAADMGEVLGERGILAAVIDLDWLGWLTKDPGGGDHYQLALDNLKAILPNLIEAGVTHLVIARAFPTREPLQALIEALPRLEVVRIDASPATIEQRLRRRDTGAVLEEHLIESAQMTEALDLAGGERAHVDNDARPIREVTEEVLDLLGWA